jgi:ELP3 family radical SAM enzyme/protein acetyltransferase
MELEDLCKLGRSSATDPNIDKIIAIVKDLNDLYEKEQITNRDQMKKEIERLGRKHKYIVSFYKVLNVYRSMASTGELIYRPHFDKLLITKIGKGSDGVMVITVWTSPEPTYTDIETGELVKQTFSCAFNCKYCPNEPGQARSYLLNEPGVLRANANKFISTDQFWDRAKSLLRMGHPLDKIELIVSGGTFSSYPKEYLTEFFRDQFYAANVAYDKVCGRKIRSPLSLEEEQDLNQNQAIVKIIGITIETRPDQIHKKELEYYRYLGITRVQIGVQHINDDILRFIDRRCPNKKTIKAIKLLKDAGFKVDIHLMPDLPAPTDIEMTNLDMIQEDKKMFDIVIEHPDYQADQWKIYPCATVPWTEIEKWYKDGTYKPYAELTLYHDINDESSSYNPLVELLIDVKSRVKPWVRLNRVIRDIPNSYIIGGNSNTSMRSDLVSIMEKRNLKCNCIRCRQVKSPEINSADFTIKIRQYEASGGTEYFISWENESDTLLGFLRLRINSTEANDIFPELINCAMIRELHIYGQVINHHLDNKGDGVQHIGLGKGLIAKAVELTKSHGLNRISVISGVGVRNYYIKQGFMPVDTYIDSENNIQKTKGKFLIRELKSDNDLIKTNLLQLIDESSSTLNSPIVGAGLGIGLVGILIYLFVRKY